MDICVIGVGYVGLVTGAAFSDLGNDVICVDIDEEKINNLRQGQLPIFEPGLEEMVSRNLSEDRLRFTTKLSEGVQNSEVIFISVNTPPEPDGKSDLSAVENVARGIAKYIDRYKVIVNKSTVPVGTGDLVRNIIETNKRREVDFDVVSNPEFLREGSAISDTLQPERIVIGAPNHHVAMKLLELYASLERPMLITDVQSAELIKYASNAFLATRLSFINVIADICEASGADIKQVVKGMGYDSRIGHSFLQAGLGYGGSCFPKDTESLIHTASELGIDFQLLKSVVNVNQDRVPRFVDRMKDVMGQLSGKTVAVLGLAFKPNTDDIREAKSLELLSMLLSEDVNVRAYDPQAMPRMRKVFPHITYANNAYGAAENADAVAIVTEWNEFRLLNLERLRDLVATPLIFDGRNIYKRDRMERLGFEYHPIGRPAVYPDPHRDASQEATTVQEVPQHA